MDSADQQFIDGAVKLLAEYGIGLSLKDTSIDEQKAALTEALKEEFDRQRPYLKIAIEQEAPLPLPGECHGQELETLVISLIARLSCFHNVEVYNTDHCDDERMYVYLYYVVLNQEHISEWPEFADLPHKEEYITHYDMSSYETDAKLLEFVKYYTKTEDEAIEAMSWMDELPDPIIYNQPLPYDRDSKVDAYIDLLESKDKTLN